MTTSPDEPSEPDDARAIDAAFDEIVANIDAPSTDEPSTDDLSQPEEPSSPTPQRTPSSDWSEWDDIRVPTPDPEPYDDDAESDDEHYVPPPPPPLPKGDRVTRWAWAGAIGAPVLAIVLSLIGWDVSGLVGGALVIAFLAGFSFLISRMRSGPRVDEGPDNGAVV